MPLFLHGDDAQLSNDGNVTDSPVVELIVDFGVAAVAVSGLFVDCVVSFVLLVLTGSGLVVVLTVVVVVAVVVVVVVSAADVSAKDSFNLKSGRARIE